MNVLEVLTTLRKGRAMAELDDEIAQMVRRVIDTGKAGTVSLTLKISPAVEDGAQVTLVDNIAIKAPQPPRSKTLFYTSADGALHRRDPRQSELMLSEVSKDQPEQPKREVTNG